MDHPPSGAGVLIGAGPGFSLPAGTRVSRAGAPAECAARAMPTPREPVAVRQRGASAQPRAAVRLRLQFAITLWTPRPRDVVYMNSQQGGHAPRAPIIMRGAPAGAPRRG